MEIEQLLVAANHAREWQQDQTDAIFLFELAYKLSLSEKYWHGRVHSLTGLVHSYKLQYQQTGNKDLVEKMDKLATEAVTVAEDKTKVARDEIDVAYETMAEVLMLKKNWPLSTNWWNKALTAHSTKDAYYGRLLGHLAESLWYQGDQQEALKKIGEAVAIIKQNDERQISSDHQYRWLVWLSGALMKQLMILTKLGIQSEVAEVQTELELLLKDPRLIHRQRQYQGKIYYV